MAGLPRVLTKFQFVFCLIALLVAVSSMNSYSMARTPLLDADEMIAALKVGIPENQDYIRNVVRLVEAGVLSEKLVYSTFQWARRKPRHRFQYFRAALEKQL